MFKGSQPPSSLELVKNSNSHNNNTNSKAMTILEMRRRSLVPARWENTVRRIGVSECVPAGLSLAHSFANDALSMYVLDGDDRLEYSDELKWELHVRMMTSLAFAHCYSGIVTSIGPDYDAVALW